MRLLNLEGADSTALAEVITDYWTRVQLLLRIQSCLHSFKPYCYQVSQHITSSTNYAISPWSSCKMRIQKISLGVLLTQKLPFPTPVCKSSSNSATQRPIRNKRRKRSVSAKSAKILEFLLPTYGPFPRGRSQMPFMYFK